MTPFQLVYLMGWIAETVFGSIGVFFWLLSVIYSTGNYWHAIIFIGIGCAFHHSMNPSSDFR